ncbi:MAG: hypothetical protein JXD23_16705 [Spirochaetales bacterium]|nr:hypothetical protein [Spirochaetales bacterium]
MKKLSLIRKKQNAFINDIAARANEFIKSIPKRELEVILLSGSAARGDYYPGRNCLGYIGYLLSDYTKDRWERREAFPQLHANLNTALRAAIKCLYYIHGKYAAPEDRRLYYNCELERLPRNYEKTIEDLFRQEINSESDYRRREALFRKGLLSFCESADAPDSLKG